MHSMKGEFSVSYIIQNLCQKTTAALGAAQEQSERQTSVFMGRRIGDIMEQRKIGETGRVLWDERKTVGNLGLAWRHGGEVESITSS